MKKIIIGLLILISTVFLFPQQKHFSIDLTMGQTVNDEYKAFVAGINVNFNLSKHLFFQVGYNFLPDSSKFDIHAQTDIVKFFGGYRLSLSTKLDLNLKAGFYWHSRQLFNYGSNDDNPYFYYTFTEGDYSDISYSFGASINHIISNNISFICGAEFFNYIDNLIFFAGVKFDL